jgi:hypothetical protein
MCITIWARAPGSHKPKKIKPRRGEGMDRKAPGTSPALGCGWSRAGETPGTSRHGLLLSPFPAWATTSASLLGCLSRETLRSRSRRFSVRSTRCEMKSLPSWGTYDRFTRAARSRLAASSCGLIHRSNAASRLPTQPLAAGPQEMEASRQVENLEFIRVGRRCGLQHLY